MMGSLSSSPCSNEHKAQKRPISVITIESHDDDVVNEVFSLSAVKRGKNETNTETFEDETSTSAESLKEDREIEDSLYEFTDVEVSNAANLTSDGDAQLNENLVQDAMKQHSFVDAGTSGEQVDSLNGSETCINNNSLNIIKAPNFEFQTTATGNKRLIVFDSNDRSMCYKFYASQQAFHCGGCRKAQNKNVVAKLFKDENGEDYVQFVNQHSCEPVKYVPQSPNFQIQQKEIIIAPNYEIQLRQKRKRFLIIFVQTNPNLCYYYRNKKKDYFICCECEKSYKKHISAKLLIDKEGTQYVQANVPHLCEPLPYVANNWHIIQSPNFLVSQLIPKLIVFNFDHPNFFYCYNYIRKGNIYNCAACSNVHRKCVSAKVIKDEDGNECLQANRNHLCDPYTYKVSDSFDIVKSPNFMFIQDENIGSAAMVRVYASNDRKSCYNFTQMESSYACSGCHSKGREFIAKVFKDEKGDVVVLVWKNQKHVCLPVICC